MRNLKTDRLILRPMEERDAHDLFACFGDDEVTRYMKMPTVKSEEEDREFIISSRAKGEHIWAIVRDEDGTVLGSIGIVSTDKGGNTAQVGYAVARAYWGHGYASEALRAVLEYGLREMGFNRMEAYHAVKNTASGAVMRKAGMLFEGIAREK